MRKINTKGLALLKTFEGCSLISYTDQGGIPTIGWGHTGKGVEESPITQERADQLLEQDLEGFYHVDNLLSQQVNDNQYSALICLAYNIGLHALRMSTLLKRINSGESPDDEWLKWAHVNGVINQGLLNRRKAELTLYHTLGD